MPQKVSAPKKAVTTKKVAKKTAPKVSASDNHNCHCCAAVCSSRKESI